MSSTTWNPSDKGSYIALSNSNRTAACSSGADQPSVRGNNSKSSGVWSFEVKVASPEGDSFCVGVAQGDPALDMNDGLSYSDTQTQIAWCVDSTGALYDNSSLLWNYAVTMVEDDVITFVVDLDNGYGWVLRNNVLLNGSSLPISPSNADFTTIVGPVFPAASLTYYGPSLTGSWLPGDLTYSAPAGAEAWDNDAIPPIEVESIAGASEEVSFGLSTIHETIGSSANIVGAARGITVLWLESSAAGGDVDTHARVYYEASAAAAGALYLGSRGHIDGVISEALATSLFVGGVAAKPESDAAASDAIIAARITKTSSAAGASETVTTARISRVTIVSAALSSDEDARSRRAVSGLSEIEASDTLTERRVAYASLTDSVVAAATLLSSQGSAVSLMSSANASSAATGRWSAKQAVEDVADVGETLRLPSPEVPVFWVNPGTMAAATWTGLPLNSFALIGGRLYGAGVDGIHKLASGQNIATDAPRASVTWDLETMGTTNLKRPISAYFTGSSAKPFSLTVATSKGRWNYRTQAMPARKRANHRAILGRGVEAAHIRFAMAQTDDFVVDRIVVEHDVVNRSF